MDLQELIEKLSTDVEDIKAHLADYCYVAVEDVDAIIEYLKQLRDISDYFEAKE